MRYAYSQFREEQDEQEELEKLIRQGLQQGLRYLTDVDARPAGAAEPTANLWDNGEDVVDELDHVLRVRRLALDRFAKTSLLEGTPLGELELDFVPLYLHHRYQVEAAVKALGGFRYAYGVVGDGQDEMRPVDVEQQRRVLTSLLSALKAEELDIPDEVLHKLTPAADAGYEDRERFGGRTGRIFDWQAAAESAIDLVIGGILHPERAARLERDPRADWGLAKVLDEVRNAVFEDRALQGRQARLHRLVQNSVVQHLIELAGNPAAADGRGPWRKPSCVACRSSCRATRIRTLSVSTASSCVSWIVRLPPPRPPRRWRLRREAPSEASEVRFPGASPTALRPEGGCA